MKFEWTANAFIGKNTTIRPIPNKRRTIRLTQADIHNPTMRSKSKSPPLSQLPPSLLSLLLSLPLHKQFLMNLLTMHRCHIINFTLNGFWNRCFRFRLRLQFAVLIQWINVKKVLNRFPNRPFDTVNGIRKNNHARNKQQQQQQIYNEIVEQI